MGRLELKLGMRASGVMLHLDQDQPWLGTRFFASLCFAHFLCSGTGRQGSRALPGRTLTLGCRINMSPFELKFGTRVREDLPNVFSWELF